MVRVQWQKRCLRRLARVPLRRTLRVTRSALLSSRSSFCTIASTSGASSTSFLAVLRKLRIGWCQCEAAAARAAAAGTWAGQKGSAAFGCVPSSAGVFHGWREAVRVLFARLCRVVSSFICVQSRVGQGGGGKKRQEREKRKKKDNSRGETFDAKIKKRKRRSANLPPPYRHPHCHRQPPVFACK